MAVEPVRKRARFPVVQTLPKDPSIPLAGHSPFSNFPNDTIDRIFCCMGDIRAKMRLELVCLEFSTRIKQKTCWQLEDKLILNGNRDSYFINGVEFDSRRAANALSNLLDRITVRHIVLNDVRESRGGGFMFSICQQISRHMDSFALKSFELINLHDDVNRNMSLGIHPLLVAIASCGLAKVQRIKMGHDCQPFANIIYNCLTPFLLSCSLNLKQIDIDLRATGFVAFEIFNNSSHLETVKLEDTTSLSNNFQHSAEYLQQIGSIASFCNGLSGLKFLYMYKTVGDPLTFVGDLTEVCRRKIQKLGLSFLSTDYQFNLAEQLTRSFPNLKEMEFRTAIWDWETVATTISNIIHHLTDVRPTTSSRSQPPGGPFVLKMPTNNIRKCLCQLTDKNGINAKIVFENGSYKCTKDDVEILLELDSQ